MEKKQLRFPIRLMDFASRRIAAMVWTEADVRASFKMLPFKVFPDAKWEEDWLEPVESKVRDKWEEDWLEPVESKVRDKVSKLPLPSRVASKIIPFVKPIGLEILRWKLFHERFLGMWQEDFDPDVYTHLYWTAGGSIDYQKTALELIRFRKLDLLERYSLATLYCLESHIKAIWDEFPEGSQKWFDKQYNPLLAREPHLQVCWTYTLYEQESQPDYVPENRFANPSDFRLRAFQFSAAEGNKAAAEYFFQKLTPQEREASLMRTALAVTERRRVVTEKNPCRFPNEKLADVFCHLFFIMTPEQQTEICRQKPSDVLRFFLEWPWHDIMSAVVDLFWDFWPPTSYDNLMEVFAEDIRIPDQNFCQTFRQLFPLSPIEFRKRFVIRESQSGFIFPRIFIFGDRETVQVIFRNIDREDSVLLLSSFRFFRHFNDLSVQGKSDFCELCIKEAALSREDKEKLKGTYREFRNAFGGLGLAEYRAGFWQRVFDYIDKTDEAPPI